MMKRVMMAVFVLCLSVGVAVAGGDKKDKAKQGAKGETTTVTAFVTDSQCAAKGNSEKHADCAKKCIEGGAKAALVTADNKVLHVVNPDTLKAHAGKQVKVTGRMTGEAFHVDSVEAVTTTGS